MFHAIAFRHHLLGIGIFWITECAGIQLQAGLQPTASAYAILEDLGTDENVGGWFEHCIDSTEGCQPRLVMLGHHLHQALCPHFAFGNGVEA